MSKHPSLDIVESYGAGADAVKLEGTPKFVKKYFSLSETIKKAVSEYVKNVENRTFPAGEHTFHMEVQK